ncbi:MAG: deoxyribonuclease IV [Acidobacteria bacterium]|nr:deoxyribonuclease IV [Acidobacteriota bacterium]
MRVGVHTSIAGNMLNALDTAKAIGCNALQIFSSSPRSWPRRAEASGTIGYEFRARRTELGLGPLVIHDNYLINLASPDRGLRTHSIQAFHGELVRAVALGADYLVAHPGSSRGSDPIQGLQWVAEGFRQAAKGFPLGDLRILVENTAGQGSSLGSRFIEIKQILDACPELNLGVCLDTAHAFAAGYDIRTQEGLEKTLDTLERTVGLDRVCVLHVNDSKAALGSRVDRHAHIGKGKIGLDAFERILTHPKLAGKAFILETPIDKPGDDRRNVAAIWKIVGRPVTLEPAAEGAPDGFKIPAKKKSKPKTKSRAKAKSASRKKKRISKRG